MNNFFLYINWLAVIPLGFTSLFFLGLTLRRGIRFFDHKNEAGKKERFLDIFLSTFDMIATVFCFMLAMSPTKIWLTIIPIGLAIFIFVIPISILVSYYQLYVVSGYMPKNTGAQVQLKIPNEKHDEKIVWYEFTPFIFIVGWLIYFIVCIVMLVVR